MGRIARQATINSLLTYVGLVLGFVNLVLLYPRILTPGELGLTRLVVSIAVIAAQIAQVGLESTTIRYFPYFRERRGGHHGFYAVVLLLGTLGGLLAMLALWLFHGTFTQWFGDKEGLYGEFGLIVVPMVLAEVWYILFRGISRSVHRSVAPVLAHEFVLRLLQTVLILAYVKFHLSFHTFAWLFAGTFLARTGLLMLDLWRVGTFRHFFRWPRIQKRLVRSMARYTAYTFGSGFASIILGNMDQMMIAALLSDGLKYVAFYSVAFLIASVIMVPARALALPAMPHLAEAWRKHDMVAIERIYRSSANVQLVVGVFIFTCFCASLPQIFALLPPAYMIGMPIFLVLGATNVISLSGGIGGGVMSTSRAFRMDALLSFLLLGLNVVLDYVLIISMGVIGTAWSSLISLVVVLVLRTAYLYRRFGLWPYDMRMLGALFLAGVAGGLAWWLPLHLGNVADMVVRTLMVSVVFWPAVFAFKLAPELRLFIGKRWQR